MQSECRASDQAAAVKFKSTFDTIYAQYTHSSNCIKISWILNKKCWNPILKTFFYETMKHFKRFYSYITLIVESLNSFSFLNHLMMGVGLAPATEHTTVLFWPMENIFIKRKYYLPLNKNIFLNKNSLLFVWTITL